MNIFKPSMQSITNEVVPTVPAALPAAPAAPAAPTVPTVQTVQTMQTVPVELFVPAWKYEEVHNQLFQVIKNASEMTALLHMFIASHGQLPQLKETLEHLGLQIVPVKGGMQIVQVPVAQV